MDFEDFGGEAKDGNSREMIAWFTRQDRLDELVEKMKKLRPGIL